jgi:hypothetical protein
MPQIKKKNFKRVALAGILGAGAVGVVENAQAVSADTVVAATTSGAGSDVIQGDSANTPDQSIVNLINSQLRNLQTASNGIVRIDSTPKILTTQDVTKVQASITKLSGLINQYNTLKAQLNAQNETNESINGMTGDDNTTNVTGSTIDQTATNLQDLVNRMQAAVNKNQQIIYKNANDHAQNKALSDIVKNDNQIISNAADTANNGKSGIIGNLDEINRKSQDSAKANGIVVDNSKTQQINTVKTSQTAKYTKVTTTQQAAAGLARILNNIKAQTAANQQQTLKANTYKTNALHNIDDLNAWLAKEQAVVKQAKEDAAAATTSITDMSTYKTQTLAKLNEAMKLLKSRNASQQMINNLQKAIDTVNRSNVTQTALPPVGQKDPYDFGDIGQDQNTQNGAQYGTISGTKTTAATNLQNAINDGVAQVQKSNREVEAHIKPIISKNETAVNKYLDAIKRGGSGSQIDDNYLNGMSIYTGNNNQGTRDFYRKFIKAALAQSEQSVDSVRKQIANGSEVVAVTGNPSIATLSAAMFAQNAGTMGNGFGSVMLKSSNINDDISGYTVDKGAVVYADSKVDGGAQAVYNGLTHLPGYANTKFSEFRVVKDMKEQYMDKVGAKNVFTVVTTSPDLVITLPNAFVYTDANGKTGSAKIKVGVSATAYDGSSIYKRLNENSPTASGTFALFVYNFAVDPYTGQLVAGVGYIAGQSPATGVGQHIPDVSGGGEAMRLGDHSDFQPMDQGAARGIGLAQSIMVLVDPNNADAVKYANFAPLYVSDIDDGQELLVYTSNKNKSKIVTASGQSHVNKVRDWRNPYGQHGEVRGIVANNKDSTDATVSQTTKIDGQSAAVYNIEGFGSGLNGMRVTLRSHDNGGDDTYTSIDTALFAPFGIVGSPQIDLDAINDDVKTLRVYDVKAKAHTDGSYSLTSDKEYLTSGKPFLNWPSNISGELTLPSYVASLVADKHVASNTSMVVRKRDPIQKLTASGNSMTVRVNRKHQTTASSTSLVVRINRKHQTTASSTSLVVRTRTTTHNTASSTSLVVRISKAIAKVSTDANGGNPTVKPLSDNQLKRVTPVVTKNADGTSTVKMSVYVDPTLTDTANAALADWKTALAAQGVNLEADITSSTTDLKNGVSLVILDANNSDDQVGASADRPYTMNGLGGLTTDTVNSVLTDPSVKFNASGTVTAGDALKNSMTAIQINSEALSGQSFKNAMLDGQLTKEVLKHELGHFLGLHHNTNDSLMTPTISNVVFDGKISDADAKQAAANLIAGLGRHTIANG